MNYIKSPEPNQWLPPQTDQAPFSWLAHLISFLGRRWRIMAAVTAATLALAIAYVSTSPPRFTAEAVLMFDVRRVDLLRQNMSAQDALTLNSVLESQVELLQSAGLARKTVERLGLTSERQFVYAKPSPLSWLQAALVNLRQGFGAGEGDVGPSSKLDAAARQLQSMLKVRRVGQTYVIAIDITSPSPAEAAWLANGVAETYLADEVQAKEVGIQQASVWLQGRLKELLDQALTADRAVQDYKASHNIVDTDRGLIGNQQLAELSSQMISARAKTAGMLARLQRIQAIVRDGIDGGTVTDGLDNKVIVALRQQYVDHDRRVAELSAKFGNEHTVVANLRAEMVEIKRSILGELTRIADTYRSDYEVARADETAVQARLDTMIASAARTNNDLVQLRALQSVADTYRSLYQNFLQRYTQAVQDQSFPVPEARIITPAFPPSRKSEPKTTIILILAAAMGMSAGFAAAFLRDVLDLGIRSASALRAATGLNCLATLPRLHPRYISPRRIRIARKGDDTAGTPPSWAAPGDILRHVSDLPRSPFTDVMRGLRMRIGNQTTRAQNIKVIGCISVSGGAGASAIAANLAQIANHSLGQSILVDWDFANSSLTHALTDGTSPGSMDILAGRTPLTEAICAGRLPNASFLPAGTTDAASPPSFAAHLDGMFGLLTSLRARYDFVVVDMPPLSTVADTHIAAHLLDAIVVVYEWGYTENEPLAEKLARIGLDETSVLGVVLNKADVKPVRLRTESSRRPSTVAAAV